MIIDELILHDFGQYRGRVSVPLTPPSPQQPIVLVGGLNGAGKTTLLDAIQLCLFGPLARISRRESVSYDHYLLGSIHRGGGIDSAAVELRFRHMAHGEEQTYHVKRSWRRTSKGCREQLEVLRNFRYDAMATEHWPEQVEEFLPSRISHLFLFDGEQVEAYADPRSSAGLIETAVFNLLGLDLVEKLGSDLSVIERRRRMDAQSPAERDRLQALTIVRDEARARLEICHSNHAKRAADLSRVSAQRRDIEERYRQEGGHLYERRAELEAEVTMAEQRLKTAERLLREAAAGAAPLLLVRGLFGRMSEQARKEASSMEAAATDALLATRDAQILAGLQAEEGAHGLRRKLEDLLQRDRDARRAAIAAPRLRLTDQGRDRLRELEEGELHGARAALPSLLGDHGEALQALEQARIAVAAVPSPEALAAIGAERDDLIAREATLIAEQRSETELLERLRRDLDRAEAEIVRCLERDAEAQLAEDDRARVLRHVGKVRSTLERFRKAVIQRHLSRIEALVLDSFQQLLRKKSLVAALRISPQTFQLELTGRDGNPLPPDQLSAGERQLLAVSVLWGLARASGRPLPTVIDTPLGRLDSSHRRRLVSHYFPFASHQVILLSTDEEIAGGYFEALRPAIGRLYHLRYDEGEGATSIENGYFSEPAYVD
jgi:DNA sulfur modification protein DndD